MIEPGWRQQNPRRDEGNTCPESEPFRGTRPGPVLRQAHQAPGHRPPFHHDAAPDQVGAGQQPRDRDRHRILLRGNLCGASGSPHPFDQRTGDFRTPSGHDQIPGVRQEAEGEQLHVMRPQQRAQVPQEYSVVARRSKLGLGCHHATADVKVAGTGRGGVHRAISSRPRRGKRRATRVTGHCSVEISA
jgi:hypothetical protein